MKTREALGVYSLLSEMKLRIHQLFAVAVVCMHFVSANVVPAVEREENSEVERIFNGRRATPGQFPYVCALYQGNTLCTCSIIGNYTVLTAAHCVTDDNGETVPAENFYAIANVTRTASQVRINFISVTPHPNYTSSGFSNDIAVLTTNESIPFSDDVQPVCITCNDTSLLNQTATAIGYGDTSGVGVVPSRTLRYTKQDIMNNDKCALYYFLNRPDDCKICAAGRWRINGICPGDSGGPLSNLMDTNNHTEIGIASYGTRFIPCGTLTPAVWTRVSCYCDFIKSTAGADTICIR